MLEEFIKKENFKNMLDRSSKQTDQTNEMLAATRTLSEKFYYQVAMLSGSAIVLSLTFLGYLTGSGSQEIRLLPVLLIAWVLLLLALLGALYRNHHWTRMIHFQAMTKYMKAHQRTARYKLELLSNDPAMFADLTTPEQVQEAKAGEEKHIGKLEDAKKFHSPRAKRAERIWQGCEWVAHIGLVIGLILLLFFAGANVWLRAESLNRVHRWPYSFMSR